MPRTFKKYSEEMEKQIAQEYVNGATAQELCKKYGFKTQKSILDKVKKHGLTPRTAQESSMLGKEYADFTMAKIDNEFKAYFIGLLLTDGYTTRGDQLGLDLTDEDAIAFCSTCIGKPYHTYERDAEDRKPRHRILLNGKRIVEECKRYGIVERKSKILSGFEFNENELKYIPYLIRGMIDGDGWVRKDGGEFYICTCSQKFAVWIKGLLENRLYMKDVNLVTSEREQYSDMYYVRTSLDYNLKILKNIIYDQPFGMSRKYKLVHKKK